MEVLQRRLECCGADVFGRLFIPGASPCVGMHLGKELSVEKGERVGVHPRPLDQIALCEEIIFTSAHRGDRCRAGRGKGGHSRRSFKAQ